MKVGLIVMALALALVIAAVVSATLRSEPERVLPAEVATKSPSEAPPYSSGQEGSATKEPSSQKESPPPSSGGPVGQNKEEAKEPQAVLQQEAQTPNSQSAMPQLQSLSKPLLSDLTHSSRLLRHPTRSLDHEQLARRRVDGYHQRPRQVREGDHGLTGRQVGQTAPQDIVHATDRSTEPADYVGVTYLVQYPVVDQAEYLVREVLRELGHEDQA